MRERPARSYPRWGRALLLGASLTVIAGWGVNLWHVRSSVTRYARWWDQPCGAPDGLLYVALGDSAAQAIGASSPELGYVGLIAQWLRESSGRPVRVVNLSRSGAKVRDVVTDQLPRLRTLRPDLITVGVGANDIRGFDAGRYERDVAALVAGLPAGTVIADMPYFMHGKAQRNAARGGAILTRLARRRGLIVAPLHSTSRRRGWRAMGTDYAADWFHPNDSGHRVWAGAFREAFTTASSGTIEHGWQ
jgi:acyl-CoA thioesterase-1